MSYAVNVYDCAGLYRETPCARFGLALIVYDAERARFPGKVVQVVNEDRVDLGCADGLTEDEREALESRPVVTCTYCFGRGYTGYDEYGEKDECPKCDGTGEVER